MKIVVEISIIALVISWFIEAFTKSKENVSKDGFKLSIAGYIFLLSVIILIICFIVAIFNYPHTGESGRYLHNE